jgi:hypothetical protein
MAEYLAEVRRMEKFFDGFEVWYVPRMDNRDVDHLVWIASSRAPTPPDVVNEKLIKPLVGPIEEAIDAAKPDLMIIDEPDQGLAYDWMSPIKMFLDNQPSSDDNVEVECIACKSKMYHLIDGILYQRGTNGMMRKCISREEHIQLLQNIHNGVCRSHSSWCSIIGKAFRHGFYWPTAKDDMRKVITNARTVNSFRRKQQSMQILFDLLISPSPLQYGESTSWASCPGH